MMKNINFRVQVKFFALLMFTLLLVAGCGGGGDDDNGSYDGTIKLGWEPNTESDLAGYRIYYGTNHGAYVNSVDAGKGTPSGGLITYTLTNLLKAQFYCIAVTAYDTSSNESDISDEVCGNSTGKTE